MAFQIGAEETLGEGLKRIATDRVERALERLRGSAAGDLDSADAIHGARKDLKKLRTVLRLLRDELPKGLYRDEMEAIRDVAQELSATRDAEVKLETLDELAERAGELPEGAVAAWRQILDRDREAAANTVPGEGVVAQLEAGLARIEGWRLEGDSWGMIGGAVRRSYRRGRQAMRAAEDRRREDDFHRWRKRAKDLWYELRLLKAAWEGPLRALADEASQLSDLLGDHHDLAVLREDLHQRRLGEEETRSLEAAIDARQEQLGEEAFDLGRRLYAERPKQFTRRLRRYWRAWRG